MGTWYLLGENQFAQTGGAQDITHTLVVDDEAAGLAQQCTATDAL